MKTPYVQLRREFSLIAGVTLLALVPLFFLWRRGKNPPIQATSGTTATPLVPIAPRLAVGPNSFIESGAQISPDGRWFARMETAPLGANPTPPPNSSLKNELVIRSAITGKEAFRDFTAGSFVGWIPGTNSFVARAGDDINVFAPTVRKPNVPLPKQPWTATTISFAPAVPTDEFTNYDDASAVAFSPDYHYAVKSSWDKGPIEWEVADLTTGKVSAPVRAGRWKRLQPNSSSNDIRIAVAPANITNGPLPIVCVLQSSEPLYSTPIPTPIPTATSVPKATPTDSPTQAQFKVREAQESAEIQTLIDKVLGIDGADPEVSDPDEVARITSEVNRRNKALELERQQLFPAAPTPIPTSPPNISSWDFSERFQLESFDLNTRKRLWISPLRGSVSAPEMQFSPDGSGLIAWETAVLNKRYGSGIVDRTGLEFRAAHTGKILKKTQVYEGVTFSSGSTGFYEGATPSVKGVAPSIFVLKDSYSRVDKTNGMISQDTVFRLFNVSNAREIGYLKVNPKRLPPEQQNFYALSMSQTGNMWLWGDSDLFILPRRELVEEVSTPLPTPTPAPTAVIRNHVSGQ
ncbi:hypothetical protein EON83_13785 [bacterium]|nr:MAG: hypothetical protein EON83_13785 [bacterium]